MQNPEEEITQVVLQLTAASSPDVQKNAVELYMTPDVAFRHPLCAVDSSPDSRKRVLGIYQWYRILSPHIELNVNNVVFDTEHNYMFLDIVQRFKLFLIPISPAPSRLCVRLTLRKDNDQYYIAMQEDFYHPEDLMALIFPPLVAFIHLILLITGFISDALAKVYQIFGFWQPRSSSNGHPHGDGPEEMDLYPELTAKEL